MCCICKRGVGLLVVLLGSRDEKRCAFFTLAKRWKNEDFPPLFSIFNFIFNCVKHTHLFNKMPHIQKTYGVIKCVPQGHIDGVAY